MNTLVIDVGGTHVKLKLQDNPEVRKLPSGPDLTAQQMVDAVKQATADWQYDAISIGYPGPVVKGRIVLEPVNLGKGWLGFDFAASFGKPVKLINDAAMQALGSYEGGRMLFLGLGTGLGNTMILDGVIAPMELGHLPYKKGRTFEEYVGNAGMKRSGRRKWQAAVFDVVQRLRNALIPEYVILGGGNVKKLDELPPGCRAGDNDNAFIGGVRLWAPPNTEVTWVPARKEEDAEEAEDVWEGEAPTEPDQEPTSAFAPPSRDGADLDTAGASPSRTEPGPAESTHAEPSPSPEPPSAEKTS